MFLKLFYGHYSLPLPQELQIKIPVDKVQTIRWQAFSWAQELAGIYLFDQIRNEPVNVKPMILDTNQSFSDSDEENDSSNNDNDNETKESMKSKQIYTQNIVNEKNRAALFQPKKRPMINLVSIGHALHSRVQTRISIVQQINVLRQNKKLVDGIAKVFAPNEPDCVIKGFDNVLSDNCLWERNQFCGIKNKGDGYLYQSLRIEDKKGEFILEGLIEIPPCYPREIPIFMLMLNEKMNENENEYCNACRQMEIQISTEFDYLTKNNENLLMSLMIYKLQLCFDQYLKMVEALSISQEQGRYGKRIAKGRDRRNAEFIM